MESQNPPAEATENFVRASTRSIWDADRGPGRCVSPRSCRQVTRGSRGAGVSNPPSRRVRPRMASVRRKSLRCVGRVRLGLEDRSRTRSWMRRRMPHIGGTGWPRKPNESLVSVMKSPDLTNRYDPTLLRLFNCQALRRPRPNSEILFGRETRVTSLRHFSRKPVHVSQWPRSPILPRRGETLEPIQCSGPFHPGLSFTQKADGCKSLPISIFDIIAE